MHQERCAALLLQRLGSLDSVGLESGCAEVIRWYAAEEMKRILSAKAHLLTIRQVAKDTGLPIVVLKGGVELALGSNVFVNDLDILAPPEKEESTASALDELGFRPEFKGGQYHLQPRVVDHALPIEVHRSVLGFDTADQVPWGRVEPILSLSPLVRLAWQDHAWTVLCQMVLKHPDRLYRIRDLFLLQRALSACTQSERQSLENRVAAHPLRVDFRRAIATANAGSDVSNKKDLSRVLNRGYLLVARSFRIKLPGSANTIERRMLETAFNGYGAEWRRKLGSHAGPFGHIQRTRRAIAQMGITVLTEMLTLDSCLLERQP